MNGRQAGTGTDPGLFDHGNDASKGPPPPRGPGRTADRPSAECRSVAIRPAYRRETAGTTDGGRRREGGGREGGAATASAEHGRERGPPAAGPGPTVPQDTGRESPQTPSNSSR
ncbi:hypothetical protein GCM10018781_06850 [Kitasatospora indigofera]|uniref:Uncharacterized protein n=1 Tax=Kitasatospora indigofera TaxID=67307 RepID=A0A919FCM5_9ACTN|nr:hypothetical protein GCM10018781_06850 [Kitasatospora indigofera]